MELDIIFESDSEDFLKNDILRILCATVCGIDYKTHFKIPVRINGWFTIAMMDLNVTKIFILLKTVKKFMIPQQGKISLIEFRIINSIFIFQNGKYIRKKTLSTIIKIQQYSEKIQFDIIKISGHNIVLKIF